MPRTLVVGDVHGCADELRALVSRARAERVVLVGDLFTKGPDPAGVWRAMRDGGYLAVMGNHDARLVQHLDGARPGDREAARCVAALDAEDPGWRDPIRALPLWREIAGWVVVHAGIHPSGALDRTDARMALTMRRWPVESPECPRWHEVYTGDRRVVFGHDAVRGLVRVERDGEPLLIGLDTGCVYGGALSGYVLERDELLQVPAARVYHPPGGGRAQPNPTRSAVNSDSGGNR